MSTMIKLSSSGGLMNAALRREVEESGLVQDGSISLEKLMAVIEQKNNQVSVWKKVAGGLGVFATLVVGAVVVLSFLIVDLSKDGQKGKHTVMVENGPQLADVSALVSGQRDKAGFDKLEEANSYPHVEVQCAALAPLQQNGSGLDTEATICVTCNEKLDYYGLQINEYFVLPVSTGLFGVRGSVLGARGPGKCEDDWECSCPYNGVDESGNPTCAENATCDCICPYGAEETTGRDLEKCR